MRAFIAVDIDDKYKKIIFDIAQTFKKYCKGSFARSELYHITLFFFGDIPDNQLKIIGDILENINFSSFNIKLIGVGCFSIGKRPRVCLVKGESRSLKEVFTVIESKLVENRIVWDKKPFKIHSTFLRIKDIFDYAGFKQHIENINKNFSVMTFTVSNIILYNSKLSGNGPEYNKLFIKNLNEVN